jgi:hypothetical protein
MVFWGDCQKIGRFAVNDSTLLLRQIHPGFFQYGRPSSQAFRPTPKDEKMLSVYDGDMISKAEVRGWLYRVAMV